MSVSDSEGSQLLPEDLGPGEPVSRAFALKKKINYRIVSDRMVIRRVAFSSMQVAISEENQRKWLENRVVLTICVIRVLNI